MTADRIGGSRDWGAWGAQDLGGITVSGWFAISFASSETHYVQYPEEGTPRSAHKIHLAKPAFQIMHKRLE